MKLFIRAIRVLMILFFIYSIIPQQVSASQGSSENNLTTSTIALNDYSIRIVIDQIYISKKDGHLEVSEVIVFRNEGPGVFYDPVNHTYFAISIPDGVENLDTNAMECCLVQYENEVYMDPMEPVKPDDNFEMKISYSLFTDTLDYRFNKVALYNTTSLSVFVNNKGGIGAGEGFSTVTIHGDEFEVISFENLTEGDEIVIPLQVEGGTSKYGTALILFVFLLAIISGFKYMTYRAGTKESLEKLELEKIKIFRTIHGFEKHAENEYSDEYRKLMDEYRQKVIQILIKIDKTKSKELDNNRDDGGKKRMFFDIFDVIRRKK
ncbi:MAG: hypothetical protein KAI86_18495 [Desulfobacterales bacterium]|nr:hypothetical protein [Desulfobacterales bacterium]